MNIHVLYIFFRCFSLHISSVTHFISCLISSLSVSFHIISSSVFATHPNLVPSVNVINLVFNSSSISSVKMLNKTKPNADPWRTLRVNLLKNLYIFSYLYPLFTFLQVVFNTCSSLLPLSSTPKHFYFVRVWILVPIYQKKKKKKRLPVEMEYAQCKWTFQRIILPASIKHLLSTRELQFTETQPNDFQGDSKRPPWSPDTRTIPFLLPKFKSLLKNMKILEIFNEMVIKNILIEGKTMEFSLSHSIKQMNEFCWNFPKKLSLRKTPAMENFNLGS